MRRITVGLMLGLASWLGAAEPQSSPVWGALIEGIDQFTLDFYQKISPAPGNLIVSPLSLSSALSIAYMGAKGETAQEMAKTLHYPYVQDSLLAATFNDLEEHLTRGEVSGYEFHQVSGLWAGEDLPLTDRFKSLVNDYRRGDFQEVNFTASKRARREINSWVKEQTAGKIPELMQEGSISPRDKLISTSALYFRADWAFPFDTRKTKERSFKGDGRTLQAEMMHGQMRLPHYQDQTLQAIALPYEGGGEGVALAMLVLLPKEGGLADFEKALSLDQLKGLLSAMTLKHADVTLPKFRMSTRVYAKDILENLGMKLPFSKGADFSGINGRHDLMLNAAVHQAYIDVDEYGTEAAAASAVIAGMKAAPPQEVEVTFVADRPFVVLVLDAATGQILFIGRVADPSSEL